MFFAPFPMGPLAFPLNIANPVLRLIELERPLVLDAVIWSYDLFLYPTPFLACSMIFSLLYVHLYRTEQELTAGIWRWEEASRSL
jgi:hypothetical protein